MSTPLEESKEPQRFFSRAVCAKTREECGEGPRMRAALLVATWAILGVRRIGNVVAVGWAGLERVAAG